MSVTLQLVLSKAPKKFKKIKKKQAVLSEGVVYLHGSSGAIVCESAHELCVLFCGITTTCAMGFSVAAFF